MALAAGFAIFGQSLAVARGLTVGMSAGCVALTALLARELAGARVARIAGWISALYVPSVALSGQTYAQHLAALCLAALAYFGLRALRKRRLLDFAIAGVALGLGCLTRPSMSSVVPILVIAWAATAHREPVARRPLAIGAAAAACVALAFVLPAQVHNARSGAGWTTATNNERNLFLGNNPYTPDYKTSHLGQRALTQLSPDARSYLESMYARPDPRSAMLGEAVGYMARHPGRTAWRTLNRATSFWGFDYLATREIQTWHGWGTRSTLPLLALEAGNYLAVAALALVALIGLRRVGDGGWRTWLVALALAYEVPYTLAFSGGTYHFPVMPLVMPMAAVAIAHAEEVRARLERNRAVWLALGAFVLLQAQYAYHALELRPQRATTADR